MNVNTTARDSERMRPENMAVIFQKFQIYPIIFGNFVVI